MAEYLIQDTTLTAIAEAIRSKTGESDPVAVADMAEKISGIAGGGLVINGGVFTGNGGIYTLEHGLGVAPDMIALYFVYGLTATAYLVESGYAISVKVKNQSGFKTYGEISYRNGTVTSRKSNNNGIDAVGADNYHFIHDANDETIQIGSDGFGTYTGENGYYWMAIGDSSQSSKQFHIKLELDGNAGLIVSGGVPEIEQLEIYVDGTLAKTVDYVYGENVIVDISDVADNRREHTISVTAIGDMLSELYPYQYYDTAEGWVSEPATGFALVDIDMLNNGVNIGTGGSAYNATLLNSGTFTGGKFKVSGTGGLRIPAGFMNGNTKTWTVAWAVDSYTPGTAAYSRFARGNNDVPSLFYSKSATGNMFKLSRSTVFARDLAYYDTSVLKPWGSSTSNALCITIPQASKTILAFRCDGQYIELWMNGVLRAKQTISYYTSTYWASTFTLGNDVSGNSYNMSSMVCSMLKAWDHALTDEQMALID